MYDMIDSMVPPTSIEVVIIVFHIFSLIGALCVCYTQAKLHRWFIARYSVVMVLYHLSQLIHLTLYGVMMIDAPVAACFTRRSIALYAPRAMQIFAAGFACRIWRAVIRQETGMFNATDSWKHIDKWTSWLAYLVPIIPAILGVLPQLQLWPAMRKTGIYDCRYAYSVRWQLIGSDAAWGILPTAVCLGMLLASVLQFLLRWRHMLRYLDARLLPISVIIRLLVVCLNIGVAGVFHVYLSFHEYANAPGDAWAPAGPDPSDWSPEVRQKELDSQMMGDILSSLLGILDFFAFSTDSDSFRILFKHCCGKAPETIFEKARPSVLHATVIGHPITTSNNESNCIGINTINNSKSNEYRYAINTNPSPCTIETNTENLSWAVNISQTSVLPPPAMSERESFYYTPVNSSILADPPPSSLEYSDSNLHLSRLSVFPSLNHGDGNEDSRDLQEAVSSVVVVPRHHISRATQNSSPLNGQRRLRKPSLAAVGR
ncbi:hypothetical protein BDF19DRAFT_432784 [Syncephalis fuscata]|nr:hypothetical protein BDF19DRAFT_432784 [Syncephalis fuscata]